MGVQTSYDYGIQKGIPGGLYDISTYANDTYTNEEERLFFGYGVVKGKMPGTTIKLPVEASSAEDFEGMVLNGFTTEQTREGKTVIGKDQSVGVLKRGRVWGAVSPGAAAAYGKIAYLVTAGKDAGRFTTEEDPVSTKMAVPAKFIGMADNGLAPIEI